MPRSMDIECYNIMNVLLYRKDFAAAIWRPEKCGAEVVLQKGKLFSHIGCFWGPKLYLTIEEAVYMVDRASMMLFQEDPKTKKKSLLSMKECFTLMVRGHSPACCTANGLLLSIFVCVRRYHAAYLLIDLSCIRNYYERDILCIEVMSPGY